VHFSHGYRGVNNVASLVTTVAHAQKIQLNLLSNSIYFSSNLVGVVLRYLGCSVGGSHRVVNSMGWSTRWGITLCSVLMCSLRPALVSIPHDLSTCCKRIYNVS
jgi:hypothetical protein